MERIKDLPQKNIYIVKDIDFIDVLDISKYAYVKLITDLDRDEFYIIYTRDTEPCRTDLVAWSHTEMKSDLYKHRGDQIILEWLKESPVNYIEIVNLGNDEKYKKDTLDKISNRCHVDIEYETVDDWEKIINCLDSKLKFEYYYANYDTGMICTDNYSPDGYYFNMKDCYFGMEYRENFNIIHSIDGIIFDAPIYKLGRPSWNNKPEYHKVSKSRYTGSEKDPVNLFGKDQDIKDCEKYLISKYYKGSC